MLWVLDGGCGGGGGGGGGGGFVSVNVSDWQSCLVSDTIRRGSKGTLTNPNVRPPVCCLQNEVPSYGILYTQPPDSQTAVRNS